MTVAVKLVGHKKKRMLHANTEFRRRLRYQTVDGKRRMGVKSSMIDEIKAKKDTITVGVLEF